MSTRRLGSGRRQAARAPLLLTGFEGFAEYPVNSSWEGVRWLDGRTIRGIPIVARQLPVEFRKIRPTLLKIL